MNSPVADSIMAATHKLVQQALQGHWQEVPKTIGQRRMLLDQLSASASPQDRQWLDALRQAMAESDVAVAKIAGVDTPRAIDRCVASGAAGATNGQIDHTLDMIRGRS